MKYIIILFRFILGFVFIYSGYSKLFPIEYFEFSFVEMGVFSWSFAPVIARIFIGLEFLLGVWLILGIHIKITLRAVVVLLVVFCGYLILLMLKKNQVANCGCFGDKILMSPLEALIKNVIMIGISIFCIFKIKASERFIELENKFAIIITAIFSFTIPTIINPPDFYTSNRYDKEVVNYKMDLDMMYDSTQNYHPSVDLRKGKHVIAYLSMSCPHCKIASTKFSLMKKKNKTLPLFLALNGDTSELIEFHKETNSSNVPYCFFLGKDNFLKLVGPEYPMVFWVDNSVVYKKTSYKLTNQEEIEKWILGK